MTVVTVQVAFADQQDTAHGGRRYCQPCSPDSLAKLTAEPCSPDSLAKLTTEPQRRCWSGCTSRAARRSWR